MEQVQEFLLDSWSVLLDLLLVLWLTVGKLPSARAVERTGKLLNVAMLASCNVLDAHELHPAHPRCLAS